MVRNRSAGRVGRAGGPCVPLCQRVEWHSSRGNIQLAAFAPRLPRLERAPSGGMASWRLIIDRSTIDNPPPSSIDRPSMFGHGSTIAFEARPSSFIDDFQSSSSGRPSVIDHKSSSIAGHRSSIDIIIIVQWPPNGYRHRSIDQWSYTTLRRSSLAIKHRLAIVDRCIINQRSPMMYHLHRAINHRSTISDP